MKGGGAPARFGKEQGGGGALSWNFGGVFMGHMGHQIITMI